MEGGDVIIVLSREEALGGILPDLEGTEHRRHRHALLRSPGDGEPTGARVQILAPDA